MRAALVNAWPSLSHWFGLHPWDVDRLSAAELGEYLAQIPKPDKR